MIHSIYILQNNQNFQIKDESLYIKNKHLNRISIATQGAQKTKQNKINVFNFKRTKKKIFPFFKIFSL